MKHCCIIGGGAALAQPLIAKWLMEGHRVTAVVRDKLPDKGHDRYDDQYTVLKNLRLADPANLLVTMTGHTENVKLCDMGREGWEPVLEGCLTSVVKALSAVVLNDGANVVVVGSIIGSTGGFGCASYAAAKAGLVGLVRAAANEWASRNICVNLLELGYCNAGMGARLDAKVRERALAGIPLRRFAEPHEVVEAIDYLSKVRYATGTILNLAGGLR